MTDQPPPPGPTPPTGDDDVEAGAAIGTEPEPAPEPEPEPLVGDEPAAGVEPEPEAAEAPPGVIAAPGTAPAPNADPAPPVDTPPEAPADPVPVAADDDSDDDDDDAVSRRLPWKPFAAIFVVFILLGVGLFFLLKKDPESDTVKVDDDVAGFTLEYPKDWQVLREPVGDERLLVSPGGQNYLFIRVLTIDPKDDAQAKIEEGLASASAPVTVVRSQQITINGTSGYYYLYSFVDDSTGVTAVHSHYFLIRGSKMYVLVFQALPTTEFPRLADTFGTIAETFKSTSDKPLPSTTSTTGPGSTDTTTTSAPATTPTS